MTSMLEYTSPLRGLARGVRFLLAAGVAWPLIADSLSAQSEKLPCVDPAVPKLQAGAPKKEARFGSDMGVGKLRVTSGDTKDDLVVCAPVEPQGSIAGVGAAWVYEDELLLAPASNFRLLPTPNASGLSQGMSLGEKAVVIANLRGDDILTQQPRDNLLLIACFLRQADYGNGCDPVPFGGSVEMYDYNHLDQNGAVLQKSIFAPPNPSVDGCPDSTPTEVRGFGYGIAVGDISGDGILDLVVGAVNTTATVPGTEPGTFVEIPNEGRVYILLGQDDDLSSSGVDFWDDPWAAWLGINAPESIDPEKSWGGHFGLQVATAHLAGYAFAEVIVGRPDDDRTASRCNPQPPTDPDLCPPQGGSAYIFRGLWLNEQFQGEPYDPATGEGTWNRVIDPPHPDPGLPVAQHGLDPDLPEYQVLRNPFGDIQPSGSGRYPLWADGFAFFVFNGGDCGSPSDGELEGDFDGIDDLLVHSEAADFIGNQTADSPQVANVGGLVLYHGMGGPTTQIVDPRPHLLQQPTNVANGIPNPGSRIGRHLARADGWYDCVTQQVKPGIFVSAPDADWEIVPGQGLVTDAGIVYLLRLPLPVPISANWWVPLPSSTPGARRPGRSRSRPTRRRMVRRTRSADGS